MTGFDYTVITIVILSALLGWWRGVVYEVLSLLGWIAASMAARLFAASLAPYMPDILQAGKVVAAFVVLFVITLIVAGIVAGLLSKFIKFIGLLRLDKSLGTLFGMLRGMLVVLALILLAGLTSLPQQAIWRDAMLSKPAQNLAVAGLALLPHSVAQRVTSGLQN